MRIDSVKLLYWVSLINIVVVVVVVMVVVVVVVVVVVIIVVVLREISEITILRLVPPLIWGTVLWGTTKTI